MIAVSALVIGVIHSFEVIVAYCQSLFSRWQHLSTEILTLQTFLENSSIINLVITVLTKSVLIAYERVQKAVL